MRKIIDNKGLTLIEIIVTLSVLGIVVVPLMTMFTTSQKINNEGSNEYKRLQVAQRFLEDIKGIKEIDDLVGDLGYTDNGDGTFSYSDNDYSYDASDTKTYNVSVDVKKPSTGAAPETVDYDSSIQIIRDNTVSNVNINLEAADLIRIKTPNERINLNITVKPNLIIINGNNYSVNTGNIKVELESTDDSENIEATLNFVNNESSAILYIIYNGNTCNINSTGGIVPQIGKEIVQKDILYDVFINVDGKQVLQGTKILK